MKLSYDDKVQIYELRKQGQSFKQLSKKFDVDVSGLKYMVKLIDRYGVEIVKKGKNCYYSPELKFIFDWYFKNQNGLSTEFQEAGDLELKYTDLYSNPYEYNIPIKIKREIAQDENKNFIVQFNIIIDKEQLPVRPKGYS